LQFFFGFFFGGFRARCLGGVGTALAFWSALIESYALLFLEIAPFFLFAGAKHPFVVLPLVTQMRALARYRVTNSRLDSSHIPSIQLSEAKRSAAGSSD
jgi:aminoglycoside phosphotransferase family enzyme